MINSEKNLTPIYVGYVLKRYPRFSETFVVNEILAHERAGNIKIDIFALGPVMETHFQDGISQVRAPVTRFDHKQRSAEGYWELLKKGFENLPHFAEKLAAAQGTVHETAQAIRLALEIKTRGIQHLHAHFGTQATTVARQAAIFADITYTFTAHAKDIYYQYEESTELGAKMRDSAATVTVSDYNAEHLRRAYGADAHNVIRIYNGMDLSKFPYTEFTATACENHIVAVGRLVPKKGFAVLLEALAILKQRGIKPSCTLIGDGLLRCELEARIKELNIGDIIRMTGPMPQPAIIEILRTARMMVCPSVISEDGDRDGLPTVLLESMALGTPVISTQVAGIPELVQDGKTGLCVPSQNPAALADAMQRLLSDGPLCENLSKTARTLIETEYDIDTNSALLRRIFRRAVECQAK